MTIHIENVLLQGKQEINKLAEQRENYLENSPSHFFYLVTCKHRQLNYDEFPDGAELIRLTVPQGKTELDANDLLVLKAQVENLINPAVYNPSKNEYTKLTRTSDGLTVYITRNNSPDYAEVVTSFLNSLEPLANDINQSEANDIIIEEPSTLTV